MEELSDGVITIIKDLRDRNKELERLVKEAREIINDYDQQNKGLIETIDNIQAAANDALDKLLNK